MKDKKTRTHVWLEASKLKKLDDMAAIRGIPRALLIRLAIREFIVKYGAKDRVLS